MASSRRSTSAAKSSGCATSRRTTASSAWPGATRPRRCVLHTAHLRRHGASGELAAMARSLWQRHQPGDKPSGSVDDDGEHRVEAADADMVGVDADYLGRSDLSERGRERQSVSLGGRPDEGRADMEAPSRRRRPPSAQAEHVDTVARDRWHRRLGDDRYRHPESVRFQRQRALDARHPERVRALRSQLGIRVVSDAPRRLFVRAGAARDENRRSLLSCASARRTGARFGGRSAPRLRSANRRIRTRLRRSCGTATTSSS